MPAPPLRALVVGGGIGGLCAAIALRQAGLDVAVFEQAPEFRPVGFGLTLWSNAVKALDQLGVGAAVRALRPAGFTGGALREADGRVLMELSGDAYEQAFGAPNMAVHRADLQGLLTAALPPGVVRFDCRCEGFTEDAAGSANGGGGGVTARLAGGRSERGHLLVGADGVRSTIRRQLFGPADSPLRYAGYTAWRGVCAYPEGDGRLIAGETWGRGRRFGIVPLNGGRAYWFAAANAPEGEGDGPAGAKARLLSLFRGWHEPVEDLIRATDEASIQRGDLYDRKPVRSWRGAANRPAGRVTLLGDAAHPTTPNLGQGACQAIEDAVVLCKCLREAGADPGRALAAYEAARVPHTARVVNTSRRFGRIAQWSNPLACRLRNALVRRTSPARQLKSLAWVVGHQV